MNIVEATKKAMEKGVGMTRPVLKNNLYILPTNTNECYIGMPIGYTPESGQRPAVRWNPHAEDILADDWELYPSQI